MRRPLGWARGFTGQVTLILIGALAAQFFAISLLVGRDEASLQRADLGRRVAEQVLTAERILVTLPVETQRRTAGVLSTRHLELALRPAPPEDTSSHEDARSAEIRASMLTWEPELQDRDLRVMLTHGSGLGRRYLSGALRVSEDRWLTFETHEPVADWTAILVSALRIGIAAVAILAAAMLLVRTLNRPLRQLAENARKIGTKDRPVFDEDRGPHELRTLSHALNDMQARIDGLIAQRTHALAAVGHDLRTPLSRLRLRLNAITEREERDAALSDVTQMSHMLQELLDYFDTGEPGQPVRSDIAGLAKTVAEDFEDMGAAVRYIGPQRLVGMVRHAELRRAIGNLVDNAVKYAGSALITLDIKDGLVELVVADEGPGIPAIHRERLRLPFERLYPSRGSVHSGIGLGLSIAARVAELHDGTLKLEDGAGGKGLRAAIALPLR